MMTSQILNWVSSSKSKKRNYLQNETLFTNKKIHSLHIKGLKKKNFSNEGNL